MPLTVDLADYGIEQYDPNAVSWEVGLAKVNYETEAQEKFMSENRNQIVRQAIRAQQEPESLQLGKLLRKSHIQLSHQPDREVAKTEAKMRFVPQKGEKTENFKDVRIAELRKCNIDLAVADPKSGKEWKSVLKSTMSAGEDVKYAAERPKGFEELGEELRKSSVLLHAGRHDFRSQSLPVHQSENTRRFDPKPLSPTVGFAATLGKELRTSNIEAVFQASSEPKTCSHWQSQQHAIQSSHQDDKWNCRQPDGFYHLIAELRKTNVTLGTDRVIYGSEGNKRPVRDDRKARAAGLARGI